jgi:hypothetical protein
MALNVDRRHPSTAHFAPLFSFEHIAEGELREISEQCTAHAQRMVDTLPDGPELSAGLRKLLEAKDCFVRAALLSLDHAAAPNTPGKTDA